MILWIAMAFAGGLFVSLSRQINGRLSLSSSPLMASFWNHIVGFAVLTVIGIIVGGLIPPGAADAPWLAFIGGPIGVIFIASGSWLIPRIGAVNTALLVISGQIPVRADDGSVPADFTAQCRLAWGNVVAQLRAAGLAVEDLIKVTIFLSDRRYASENRAVRQEVLGAHPVALTVIITGIFDEKWLLEIEAMAAE